MQLECPVEVDCPKQAYGWSKSASLAPEAPSATVPSIEKTLSVEVGGARDGGFYSCFSYCRREVVSTVKLEGESETEASLAGGGWLARLAWGC